jgi:hypothetical protein
VSLESERRLKELSVKQDGSQFYWIVDGKGNKVNIAWHKELTVFAKHGADWSAISAFTVAELGEMFCGWERCMLKRIHPVTIKNGLNVFT